MISNPDHPDADYDQVGPVQAVTTAAACRKVGPKSDRHNDTPPPHRWSHFKPPSRGQFRLSRPVKTAIANYHLADTLAAQQDLALRTIRSLVEDGLMEIGDLPGPDGRFPAWNLQIDAAMERVYDRFVRHYDDSTRWEFSIWLGLTDSGKRTAKALKA